MFNHSYFYVKPENCNNNILLTIILILHAIFTLRPTTVGKTRRSRNARATRIHGLQNGKDVHGNFFRRFVSDLLPSLFIKCHTAPVWDNSKTPYIVLSARRPLRFRHSLPSGYLRYGTEVSVPIRQLRTAANK